jgi:hypothetical protein
MGTRQFRVLLIAMLGFCGVAVAQASGNQTSLAITAEGDRYVLTVPVSRLIMTIPKGNLERKPSPAGGATASSRYFLFENHDLHLFVSGWFESARGFSGIKEFWSKETEAWKKANKPEPHDVSFEKIGSWDAILYELLVSGGGSSHIRAHWVQAGTWIDLHISITSEAPPEDRHRNLRAFLNAIHVSEKAP